MKKIVMALLLMVMLVMPASLGTSASAAVEASPVQASIVKTGVVCETLHFCGDFYHKSPDEGYDDPIKITCDYGDKSPVQYIAEGEHATCHDTDGFYVPSGKNVTCTAAGWDTWLTYNETGWHKIFDRQDFRCVIGIKGA